MKTEVDIVSSSVCLKGKKKKGKEDALLAYPLGAKILVQELHFEIGGGGTNTAVSFARLGLKTGYLGKIGRDNNGLQVYNLLHREKISFLGTFGEKTGYSVVLDSQADDRTILTFKGCNDEFDFRKSDKKNLKTKWFYLCSMTNSSFKSLIDCAVFAGKNKIKVAFNPSRYIVLKGAKSLMPIFKNTNVLVLNREEAEILSGKKELEESLFQLKEWIKDYVVVTDGGNGCWCFDGQKIIRARPLKNIKIKETTGAGDAFASAFVAGLMKGKDAVSSVKMGMLQSESVIRYIGAKNILLSERKMSQLLKKDRRQIVIKNVKR
ncbi:MAG: carbohydrate kinase family protein [Candidatus Nanoarchaeia archaeon]